MHDASGDFGVKHGYLFRLFFLINERFVKQTIAAIPSGEETHTQERDAW